MHSCHKPKNKIVDLRNSNKFFLIIILMSLLWSALDILGVKLDFFPKL